MNARNISTSVIFERGYSIETIFRADGNDYLLEPDQKSKIFLNVNHFVLPDGVKNNPNILVSIVSPGTQLVIESSKYVIIPVELDYITSDINLVFHFSSKIEIQGTCLVDYVISKEEYLNTDDQSRPTIGGKYMLMLDFDSGKTNV